MRPQLPLLPIPSTGLKETILPHSTLQYNTNCNTTISPRRPPTLPPRSKPTWRSILVRSTAPRLRAEVVGVALLAAEAKRRGGLMLRERRQVGNLGSQASTLLKNRVSLLERDVKALMKTVAKAKAKVRAQLKSSSISSNNSSPRSIIVKR